MEKNLKGALALSFDLHAGIFLFGAARPARPVFVTLPVDLMFFNPPAAPPQSEPEPQAPPQIVKPVREKEIVIPKKARKPRRPPPKAEKPPEPEPEPAAEPAMPAAGAAPVPARASSPISIDAVRFPYAYYTGALVRRIARNWQWAREFGQLKAVVYFRIARDGSVLEASVKETSGDPFYDQQALRAVQRSSPFPPLPEGYEEPTLGVFFEFSFRE